VVVAVVAVLAGQRAYPRGSLAWLLPALILLDPLAAMPAAGVVWSRGPRSGRAIGGVGLVALR
jgi:hypothetical protein